MLKITCRVSQAIIKQHFTIHDVLKEEFRKPAEWENMRNTWKKVRNFCHLWLSATNKKPTKWMAFWLPRACGLGAVASTIQAWRVAQGTLAGKDSSTQNLGVEKVGVWLPSGEVNHGNIDHVWLNDINFWNELKLVLWPFGDDSSHMQTMIPVRSWYW